MRLWTFEVVWQLQPFLLLVRVCLCLGFLDVSWSSASCACIIVFLNEAMVWVLAAMVGGCYGCISSIQAVSS